MTSTPETPAKKSRSWAVVRALVAVILIGFVISKTDLPRLYALRGQISGAWLLAVLALYLSLTVLKAWQYYFLIGRQVRYHQVLNIVVIQNAISNFIASSAGIASYLALFRVERGVRLSRAAAAFLLTKMGDLISVWLFLLVSSALIWPEVGALHGLIIILLAALGGAIVVFFMVVLMRRKFIPVLNAFVDRTQLGRFGIVNRVTDVLQTIAGQEQGFVVRMLSAGILFSLVYMAVTMAWMYASLRAFSFEIGILPVIFVNTLMQLLSYVPIQVFGGLGVAETSMLYLYGFFHFPQAELAAVLIGNRLLFYLTNLAVLLYLPMHAFLTGRVQGPVK